MNTDKKEAKVCSKTKTGKHHFKVFVRSNGTGGMQMFSRCIRCGYSSADDKPLTDSHPCESVSIRG